MVVMTLSVFYTPRMVADSGSMSPSAAKPAAVVADWQAHGLALDIIEPTPVTVDDLARAHVRDYVEDILAGRAPNGFGNRSAAVAATLLWTNGSMLSAARHAIAHHTIAASPSSGFHHAGRYAGAFCTFNGLVVAACALRAEGRASRVAIVDCDMHYGDGTDWLIEEHGLGEWLTHYTAGEHYDEPGDAADFFARLPGVLRDLAGCDVVLYQAGADPHIDDPLGGWLTTAELRRRDELVFTTLRRMGIPVAWNLAGGYQVEPDGSIPRVLEIHTNTARAALNALSSTT